ncbi:carbohydrate ABC transporter permease [Brachybacterium sp. ACRRE]|uniref:carbohydrate ABC transporter permease n=1 Tax=Brachybacterium sp. ACRRE TaxID=2918184 RepID=UPI001EF17181|nr:sugar ABC transporter permease [Brachybacterium sp. ACRRE]
MTSPERTADAVPDMRGVLTPDNGGEPDIASEAEVRRARRRSTLGHWALFLVLVLPNLALLAMFTYRPLLDNIRLSFFDWNISSPIATFIGFQNYAEWASSPESWQIVRTTVVFTVCAVAGSMVLGLAMALLLDQKLRGRNIVRSAIFAPFVLSGAAVGIAFSFVFDPHFGMIRDLLGKVGAGTPDFYQSPGWALAMITITYIWKNVGYSFVIYLAALQGARADLYEAAAIDHASTWTTFTKVTLPQLRPTTFFLSITVMLNSLQVFDIINVMTRGGPQGTATTTMIYQVYLETFQNQRAGYGATVATIMFVVLLIITLIQVRVMDKDQTR